MKTLPVFGHKPPPLHAFLLAALYVLSNYREAIGYVRWWELPVWLGTVLLGVCGLWLFLKSWISQRYLAGLLAFGVVLFLGYYGQFRGALDHLLEDTALSSIGHDRYLLPVVFAAAAGGFWWCSRKQRRLLRIKLWLNVATILMVLATVVQCLYLLVLAQIRRLPATSGPGSANLPALVSPAAPPDIYYLLCDAYTSRESLDKYWHYDNSPFVAFLEQRGFQVLTNAHGNYANTLLCMLCSLSMSYPATAQTDPWTISSQMRLGRELRQAPVAALLQNAGYQVVNLSAFDLLGTQRFYRYFRWPINSLGEALYVNCLVGHFQIWWKRREVTAANQAIISRLQRLPGEARTRPRFVYAHLMLPHQPFEYDRNDQFLPHGSPKPPPAAYLDQLIHVNHVLTNLVSNILAKSKRPPIIILQGDHGSRLLRGPESPAEAVTILNAYHLPGAGTNWLYPGITPVNTFRMIFNHYFGAHYPYLPDRQFLYGLDHELNL